MATALSAFRTKVQTYLRDPGNDHWSQTQIDEAIQRAVDQMWRTIRSANDDALLLTAVDYTWPANQINVALTGASLFNTTVVFLREVMQYADTSHDMDTTYDVPTPLEFTPFRHLYWDGWSTTSYPYEKYQGSWGDGWAPNTQGLTTCTYSLQGPNTLYLAEASRIPRRSIKLRLYGHVPWALPTDPGDEPVPDDWDRFSDFVVFAAVMLLKGQSNEEIQHVMYQHDLMVKQLEAEARDLYTVQGYLRARTGDL